MTEIIDLATGTAAAVFDGTHSQTTGSGGAGIVMLSPGAVRLIGMPTPPPVGGRWVSGSGATDAEYFAAASACEAVQWDMPETRSLRLVGDCLAVIDAVEGRTAWRGPGLGALVSLGEQGTGISGRWIKAHMETGDLPTRLNGIAHWLALMGSRGIAVDRSLPMQEGWLSLLEREPGFRPERSYWRKPITLAAAARMLDMDIPGIAELIGEGRITPQGANKAKLARRLADPGRAAHAMNTVLVEWEGFAKVYETLLDARAAEILDSRCRPERETAPTPSFA